MRRIGRIGFGAAVAVVFGFGASQMLAKPALAALPPVCNEEECNARCQANGYSGGYCELDRYCTCTVPIQP
ncbi:MAG TPA: hypothetical protein VHG28_13165 [Longimicrobiaceae bacterium]|nr:hypothetical protein [Longimicrobiaceae bacterium]